MRRMTTSVRHPVFGDIEAIMKMSEDSVMVIDLVSAGDSSRFLFLGHHERLPSQGAVIT